MNAMQQLLTEHMVIWTAADTEKKSGRGRASGNAGSVYGIKKLRELILELAVRGKLVPQDPNDEPASELLQHIQAEKAKLVAEGKIKKDKPLAVISNDEKPFDLPQGWVWSRLGNTGKIFNGNSINEDEKEKKYTHLKEGFPFIATKDVGYGRDVIDYANGVLIPFDNESFKIAHKGAVLICSEGGSAGKKIGISDADICFGNKLYANETWAGIVPRFIFYVYQSPSFFQSFSDRMTGIIGGISINEFFNILIPIPPKFEQARIVAKVDELMALCDQLETQHSNAAEAHEKLVSHLLGTLTQSQSADDFSANWQSIAAHFDTLFTTEASIDALKQTLLQLAVMGKLVPQDPNDEPASELLERIQVEKAKLIAEGKLKKGKPLSVIGDDEKPFELPKGWAWVRLVEIANIISGNAFNSEDFNEIDGVKAVKITNAGVHEFIETNDYLPVHFARQYSDYLIKTGDLILAQTRPYILDGLKISLCSKNYNGSLLNQRVVAIRVFECIINSYAFVYMKTPKVLSFYMSKFSNSGLQPNLKLSDVTELLIPIPSLNEQHRIVAKVDELMALCDQLKTCIQQANQQQQVIADVLVAQALN